MDSVAGHRMTPEPTAAAEKLEIGREEAEEVLPAWALPGVLFERAWQQDEAQTERVPPAPMASWAPLE